MLRPPEAFIRAEIAYRQEKAVAAATRAWRKQHAGRRLSHPFTAPASNCER